MVGGITTEDINLFYSLSLSFLTSTLFPVAVLEVGLY